MTNQQTRRQHRRQLKKMKIGWQSELKQICDLFWFQVFVYIFTERRSRNCNGKFASTKSKGKLSARWRFPKPGPTSDFLRRRSPNVYLTTKESRRSTVRSQQISWKSSTDPNGWKTAKRSSARGNTNTKSLKRGNDDTAAAAALTTNAILPNQRWFDYFLIRLIYKAQQ